PGADRQRPRTDGGRRQGTREENRLDRHRAGEPSRPGSRRCRDRRRALRVTDYVDAVEGEGIEEAHEIRAELLPPIPAGRLVALAMAALIQREHPMRRAEVLRVRCPDPGVEAGRMEEEERRAVPPEVEVVETEVSHADVVTGGATVGSGGHAGRCTRPEEAWRERPRRRGARGARRG